MNDFGSETQEPIWKGFVSIEFAIVVVLTIVFWCSLTRPWESKTLIDGSQPPKTGGVDADVYTEKVLDQVQALDPWKLMQQGNTDEAIGEANKMAKEHPYDVRSLMCAGGVLAQVGDKEKGLKLLGRAMHLAPQSRYVRLHYARQLVAMGRLPEAQDEFNALLVRFPKGWNQPRQELANTYLLLGEKLPEAVKQLKSIVDEDDHNSYSWIQLGIATGIQGLPSEGFQAFQQAAKYLLASPSPQLKLELSRHGGSMTKTEAALTKRVSADPKDVADIIILTELLLDEANVDLAQKTIEDGMKVNQTDPNMYYYDTLVLIKKGADDGLAMRSFQNGVQQARENYGKARKKSEAIPQ